MTNTQKLELVPVTAPSAAPPTTPAEPEITSPPVTGRPRRERQSPPKGQGRSTSAPQDPPPALAPTQWREWSSFDRTVSYRLPPELVTELEERLWKLRLPAGVTVAAALTELLDLDDEQLRARVARAEASKPRRRRAVSS